MEITRSEDSLIFNGLTPKITKISRTYDAIDTFMRYKQDKDPSDRFNFISFQETGPSYLDHFTFEPELVLNTLKSLERKSARANIAGGIFVAISFIIDVYKKISEKVFRLIILTDDGSHKIQPHHLPLLEDLIDKVKDMPFFIDVIRINADDVEEGQKLAGFVKRTNGKFYDIEKVKELGSVLTSLSEKKYIRVPAHYQQQKKTEISDENKPFYANLADDPLKFDGIGTCSICFQKDATGIVQCPSCEVIAHKKCWAQWAKTSNIGIFYVFRCHNCFNILKLEEQYVFDVQAGKEPTKEEIKKIKRQNMVNYLREQEVKQEPKIISVEDPMEIDPEVMAAIEAIEPKKREGPRIKVIICPNCSDITTSLKKTCPTCGYRLF